MGVKIGEATGDFPHLLRCGSCGARYETDETMDNSCPECGSHYDFESVNGDTSAPWREEDDSG